jgi:hypothetical protein
MERQYMSAFRMALAALLVVACGFTSTVVAHHSAAAMDFANTIEVEGIVQSLEVVNPHLTLVLRVTDERGTREIEFEGHSRNNVYRSGWRPDSIHPGDRIRVTIAPMRDGSDGGYVTAFVTASGERIG